MDFSKWDTLSLIAKVAEGTSTFYKKHLQYELCRRFIDMQKELRQLRESRKKVEDEDLQEEFDKETLEIFKELIKRIKE